MARRWATLQKAKRQQSVLLPEQAKCVGGIPKEQISYPLESHSPTINHALYEKLSGYFADTSRMADLAHSQFGDRHWARQNIARSIT
ncbi:hypothetical protein QUB80_06060 [Chlorogloeopsis sp. ULAP01]|uniref:hypothetical protein n=1 Tax=Chlorogloeopsis sp. ULAP01 TaxID=3056483 RepID=UPI0025AABE3C|nr:hypothetical protein [Chlorogloeopsis sp. ULAP01]MDM9380266.1 hypothetical protein [Chlorogloeopsis sp. ULAP01]